MDKVTTKDHKCQTCGKRFRDNNAHWTHAKDKKHNRPKREHKEEPSYADSMVEAEMMRDGGQPMPGWMADMLP